MSLTKKPYIFMKFRELKIETEKAYLLLTKEFKEVWMPKSICKIQSNTIRGVTALIAPFKYEEMTGNEIIPLTVDIKWRLPKVEEPKIPIIEVYKLYEKQKEAVKFILNNKRCALFAQTRTGKTIISLTCAKSRFNSNLIDNLIIICPVRIIEQWTNYCKEFNINNFYICGIEQLSNEHTRYINSDLIASKLTDRTMVIIDESHLFKNKDAIRTKLFMQLINIDSYKLIMTGTPIGKHMGDLYKQFEILDKRILNYSSYNEFENAHLLYGGREGKKVVAYINIEEFTYSLSPYIYQLTRKEILKERPINKVKVGFDLENQEEYYRALLEMKNKKKDIEILGSIVKLQVITAQDKNRLACLKKIITNRPVIFYKFNIESEILQSEFNYPILNGKTKKTDFLKIINDYNEFKIDGLIVNQSLAVGFDLGTAEQVIFYSSLFDVIKVSQATDRAMSMFNDSELDYIEIYANNTIDEQIIKCLERKENIKNSFYKELEKLEVKENEEN